jgi:uncharacterized membrane protein YeiH
MSPYSLQMIGTAVFAITGVLALAGRQLDVFGGLVLGVVAALGGGTMRDLIIRAPVFWVEDPNFVWVAVAASILAFFVGRLFRRTYQLLLYLDGLGAAMFAVAAANKVLGMQMSPVVAVIMGVMTAIGGGLARDVLAGRRTLLMSREIYATPILIGCGLYVLSLRFVSDATYAGLAAMAMMFGFRAAVIRWNLVIPGWLIRGGGEESRRAGTFGTGDSRRR